VPAYSPAPSPIHRGDDEAMRRAVPSVITVLVFLAAILALASAQARGNPFAFPEFARMAARGQPVVAFTAISLGYVALAAYIAAALACRRARVLALALGWIAAVPALIVVVVLVVDATGLALVPPNWIEDPNPVLLAADRFINVLRGFALLIGFNAPFSAAPVLFGLAFPIVMAVRGSARLLRRTA
jgi:hypothetical protein